MFNVFPTELTLRMLHNSLRNLNLQIKSLYRQIEGFDDYLEIKLKELEDYVHDLKEELTYITTDNMNIKQLLKVEIDRVTIEFDLLKMYRF